MTNTKPTDAEIINALRGFHSLPTYVVKNVVRRQHPGLQTPWVLRRLKAMERVGLVRRVEVNNSHLNWAAGYNEATRVDGAEPIPERRVPNKSVSIGDYARP